MITYDLILFHGLYNLYIYIYIFIWQVDKRVSKQSYTYTLQSYA